MGSDAFELTVEPLGLRAVVRLERGGERTQSLRRAVQHTRVLSDQLGHLFAAEFQRAELFGQTLVATRGRDVTVTRGSAAAATAATAAARTAVAPRRG